jgi:hypothetical protein
MQLRSFVFLTFTHTSVGSCRAVPGSGGEESGDTQAINDQSLAACAIVSSQQLLQCVLGNPCVVC